MRKTRAGEKKVENKDRQTDGHSDRQTPGGSETL